MHVVLAVAACQSSFFLNFITILIYFGTSVKKHLCVNLFFYYYYINLTSPLNLSHMLYCSFELIAFVMHKSSKRLKI